MAAVLQFFRTLRDRLFRTQSLSLRDRGLNKCLTVVDLIAYGISSTVGSGIYVSTGIAARGGRNQLGAGPAVTLSYLGAGLASLFSALCYAEFAARVPIAGSAYTFSYVSLGEIIAWIIGWCLTLEYAISASAVARGWAGNFCQLAFPNDGCPAWLNGWSPPSELVSSASGSSGSGSAEPVISTSLLSVLIIWACIVILIVGAKESSTFNVIMTFWNLAVILFVIILGSFHITKSNWHPQKVGGEPGETSYLPNGMNGVFVGAGTVFFSYIGFDSVTTLAAEVKNPKRDMPLGIIGTLGVATILYVAASLVLTGMIPYDTLNTSAPLAQAFGAVGLPWAQTLVAVGSLTTLTATTLTSLMGQPRIFYQMAKDGLLLPMFLRLSARKIPVFSTIMTGILASILAAIFDLDLLSDMISIGTLLAFSMVCSGMLIVRFNPKIEDDFVEPTWGRVRSLEPIARLVGRFLWVFIIIWWALCITFALLNRFEAASIYFLIPGIPMVIVAILLLTLKPQDLPVNFACPGVPITPLIGVFVNTFLILQKTKDGLIYFSIWLGLGIVLYFAYGFNHSRLNDPNAAPITGEESFDDEEDENAPDRKSVV